MRALEDEAQDAGDRAPAHARRGDTASLSALGIAAVCLAAIYPLVEAIRLVVEARSEPLYGDNALIDLAALRASHFNQLVGPYSREGFHHPGPIAFYVMAPFVRGLGSGQGGYLAAILVTGACAVAATALLWRWCGAPAALTTVSSLGAFELCVRVFTLREPWNPYMVVAPMLLLGVLVAGALSGRRGAWMWAAVVASYEVQTHISTAVVAVVLLLAPIVPAALRRRRVRPSPPSRVAAIGAAAVVLAWLPSVVELFADRPNNLTLMWDFFRSHQPEPSWHSALKAAANAVAIVPFGNQTYVNVIARPRWELAVTLIGLVVVAVIAVIIARGRRLGIPVSLVAAATIVVVFGVVGLKRASGGINAYFATWMATAPALVLIAAGAALFGGEREPGRPASAVQGARVAPHPLRTAGLVALAVVATAGTVASDLTMTAARDAILAPQVAVAQLATQIEARHPRGAVALDIESDGAWPQAAGVALALYRHHVSTIVRPAAWTLYFGKQDRPDKAASQAYAFYTAAEAQADRVPAGSILVATDGVVMAAGPPPSGAVPDPLP